MKYYVYFILIIGMWGCSSSKKIATDFSYFQHGLDSAVSYQYKPLKIQVGDKLSVFISSESLSQEQIIPFKAFNESYSDVIGKGNSGLIVDPKGDVWIPIIGNVKAEGLTCAELSEEIKKRLNEYVKYPVVDVKATTFVVKVLGEVNKPGFVNLLPNNPTILDAIAGASDLNEDGRRDNVLVIREENGKRIFYKIDITNAGKFFNSPAYKLKQNDFVYVSPTKRKLIKIEHNNDIYKDKKLQDIIIVGQLVTILLSAISLIRALR